jgi:threonyl-tRNA synthetase
MLVVGDREAAEGTVGVRHRVGGDQGALRTAAFIEAALNEVRSRAAGPAAQPSEPAA